MSDADTTHKPALPDRILRDVFVYANPAEVAHAAARRFVEWAWQFIARDGVFRVALSGGKTPRELYRLLGAKTFRTQVDWGKVQLFWGDERAVPADHAESNYGMVRRELLVHIPIPPGNVHRMEADRPNLGRAAQDYEDVLRRFLPLDDRGFPRLHLVLLGLGRDGQTASLFPGLRRSRETSRWVSTPQHPQLHSRRMTLTLPVLNAAHLAMFLVMGAGKAEALRNVLEGASEPPLPAQLVSVPHGRRLFLADQTAARLLGDAASRHSSAPLLGPKSKERGERKPERNR